MVQKLTHFIQKHYDDNEVHLKLLLIYTSIVRRKPIHELIQVYKELINNVKGDWIFTNY